MSEAMGSSLLTLAVLEFVAAHQPVRVSEVAAALARPKSTVQRALVTLREAGWIRADGSEWTRWVLTPRVLEVARGAANELGLRDAAHPVLDALRRQVRESVMLAVREGDDWVVVDFFAGQHPLRVGVRVGLRMPLSAGAAGKVMLAFLRDDEVDAVIGRGLRSITPATITSGKKLRQELARIRENGFAYSDGEVTAGVSGLAAPVLDRDGFAIGAISLTVPQQRLGPEMPDLAARMVEDAASITAQLRPRGDAGTPPDSAV